MPSAYETDVFTPPLSSRATRQISKRSRTSVRTFLTIKVPADQGRSRRLGLESKGEADCLFLTLATGKVYDVREQVGPIAYRSGDGQWRQHTFDLLFTLTDGTRIAKAVKPYQMVVAKRFDDELAWIARAAVPGFCDKVVLFTNRDYTPAAVKEARRLYYSRLYPDPEADVVLSHLCTDLHGCVQIRALAAQATAIGDGDLLHLSRGQIVPTSFVGRPA